MSISTYLDRVGLSRREFAARVGVSTEAVRLWQAGERLPSAKRAIAIERLTDGAVSRAELRPDIFGPDVK
jgi:DNA-binding transcriptional regulator YdaS (Cro superfamily)